jgi:hypothetical protein
MQILSAPEQATFESPPEFLSEQRKNNFSFPGQMLSHARGLKTSSNQIGFLLSCGYFMATFEHAR